jgi:hypothetical protein
MNTNAKKWKTCSIYRWCHLEIETLCRSTRNLSRHADLFCELEPSLLMKGVQIREISKLAWLIGLVKHVIWADSLYFLYLLLLSIYDPLHRHVGLIFIFLEDPVRDCAFSPPSLRTETDPAFETSCFPVPRTSDDGKSPKTQ